MLNWLRGRPTSPQSVSQATQPVHPDTQSASFQVPSPMHNDRSDVEPPPDEGKVQITDGEADELLSESQTSLVMSLIKSGQLSVGMDLTKVTLPTFILEPRSLTEKLSDFWMHPDIFLEMCSKEPIASGFSPELSRMMRVVKWYLSGFHVRPKGVKKPYNPILGEEYECVIASASNPDSKVMYCSEQVSHHPPITAFCARGPGVIMHGMYYPRSKYLGNSAASIGEGSSVICFDDGEVYHCLWPTIYVRGILFGKLLMEIGGKVQIVCRSTGYHTDIDFNVKGFFSGEYNSIKGGIYHQTKGYKNPEVVLTGKWSEVVSFKSTAAGPSAPMQVLFDIRTTPLGIRTSSNSVDIPPDRYAPLVWQKVTEALKVNDVEGATSEKKIIETAQRDRARDHQAEGLAHQLHLFTDLHPEAGAYRRYDTLQWAYTGEGVNLHPYISNLLDEMKQKYKKARE